VDGGRYELIVAGAARRHQYAFDEEFTGIKDVLVAAFGAGDTAKDRARALRDARAKQKQQQAERGTSTTETESPTTKEST
ncbi:MAG TPA: hypothetical protein VGF99_06725, partial [Myxococcota bacterium]